MNTTALLTVGVLVLGSLTSLGASQDSRPADRDDRATRVALTSQTPSEGKALRWSPKGAKVALHAVDGRLEGALSIGPKGMDAQGQASAPNPMAIWLAKSEGSARVDRMWLDRNRDGQHSADEEITLGVSESRGKFWSSGELTLQLPRSAADGSSSVEPRATRDYPMSFWFVEDPAAPDQELALRWSRRGWHQGTMQWQGEAMHVLITEVKMDGVFDGGWIEMEPFDPGVTRAAEELADDNLREDKLAERAETPLAFGHDYEAAVAKAKAEGKVLLVDFETTWCGPCKTMDALVYTAKDVVDAAAARGIVAVKVDGDDHRDLNQAFAVQAYPTMILLDFSSDAKVELDRHVGYLSVKDMARFLSGAKKPAGE